MYTKCLEWLCTLEALRKWQQDLEGTVEQATKSMAVDSDAVGLGGTSRTQRLSFLMCEIGVIAVKRIDHHKKRNGSPVM